MKATGSRCAILTSLAVVMCCLLPRPAFALPPCVDNALAHTVGVSTPVNGSTSYVPTLTLPPGRYRYSYTAAGTIPFQSVSLVLNGGTGWWPQPTSTLLSTSPNTVAFNMHIPGAQPVCSSTTLHINFEKPKSGFPAGLWVNYCNFDLKVVAVASGEPGNLTYVNGVSRAYYAGSDGFAHSLTWTPGGWSYAPLNVLNSWGTVRIGGRMASFGDGGRIFFKGTNGRLYNLVRNPAGSGWNLSEVLPGLPSVAGNVTTRGNNEVIFVGSDHKIHRLSWVTLPNGSKWQHEAIDKMQVIAASQSIAAVPGTESIFFASSAVPGTGPSLIGAVHHPTHGGWLQETISHSNTPVAYQYQGGLLATENDAVYYKGRDNFIHRFVRGPNGWIFDDMAVSPAAGGRVVVGTGYLTKFPGEERVFYKDGTGRIYNLYRQNGAWHNSALRDAVTSTAGDLVAAENKIFYINHDRRVHNFYWGSNSWWDGPLSASSPANARGCIGPYYS